MGHLTWPRPFQRQFVFRRLGLATFNPRTKFEMFSITCNEEMKATPNVKIFILSHPLGDLGVTHRVHLRLDGKRIVGILLAIIEFFLAISHGCGTIKRNLSKLAFSDGGGSL